MMTLCAIFFPLQYLDGSDPPSHRTAPGDRKAQEKAGGRGVEADVSPNEPLLNGMCGICLVAFFFFIYFVPGVFFGFMVPRSVARQMMVTRLKRF